MRRGRILKSLCYIPSGNSARRYCAARARARGKCSLLIISRGPRINAAENSIAEPREPPISAIPEADPSAAERGISMRPSKREDDRRAFCREIAASYEIRLPPADGLLFDGNAHADIPLIRVIYRSCGGIVVRSRIARSRRPPPPHSARSRKCDLHQRK